MLLSVAARSDELFAAVKAAFTHPEHATDPLLRKDYGRLMKAVNLRAEVFSKQQRAQLEVYSILVSPSAAVCALTCRRGARTAGGPAVAAGQLGGVQEAKGVGGRTTPPVSCWHCQPQSVSAAA